MFNPCADIAGKILLLQQQFVWCCWYLFACWSLGCIVFFFFFFFFLTTTTTYTQFIHFQHEDSFRANYNLCVSAHHPPEKKKIRQKTSERSQDLSNNILPAHKMAEGEAFSVTCTVFVRDALGTCSSAHPASAVWRAPACERLICDVCFQSVRRVRRKRGMCDLDIASCFWLVCVCVCGSTQLYAKASRLCISSSPLLWGVSVWKSSIFEHWTQSTL